MFDFLRKYWEPLLFAIGLSLLLFIGGSVLTYYKIFPASVIVDVLTFIEESEDLERDIQHSLNIKPLKALEKTTQKEGGVVKYDSDKAYDSVTFIAGLQDKYFMLKLIDMNGKILNKWDIPFSKAWSDAKHLKKQPEDQYVEIGSGILYPDGDVIFCYQYKGLVRADKNGNIIWKKPILAHHLMFKDQEGYIWAPVIKSEQKVYQFGRKHFILEDPEYVFKISPDGEVLEEFDILEALIKGGKKGLLSSYIESLNPKKSPMHKPDPENKNIKIEGKDLTHLNDIEVIETDAFNNLPGFNKGDIVVSLKHVNSIVVIDRKTKIAKWVISAPFAHQHDVDMHENATLTLFDNEGGGTEGIYELKSRVIKIDPATGKVDTIYEKEKPDRFYSYNRGNHQFLPNGNIFIIESCKGHLFEIDKNGEIVWEFFDKWNHEYVRIIGYALKYPVDYAKFLEEKEK
jgi:hypothetical protein